MKSDLHNQLVVKIAAQVRVFYDQKQQFKIYHGSTNSTRVQTFDRASMVDVSRLNRVLSVDKQAQTAIVEPNVAMDALVNATLSHGLVPPVVMEFPGITVGGGLQGGAGESSSFKHGCFNQIINWVEIVLANGQIVRASRTQNSDLFYGMAGSYGTLGVVTAAEIKLSSARRYVNIDYHPVGSFTQAVDLTKTVMKQDYDFIDGIMFAKDHGVIMTGRLSDTSVGPIHRFRHAHDPWFFLHAEQQSQSLAVTDYEQNTTTMPLLDYLFRYDRGAFWMGRYAFESFGVPFNSLTRWLLNPLFKTRKMYEALQASGASQEYIIQDLAIPMLHAKQFMERVTDKLGIFPLWLCPLLPDTQSRWQSNYLKTAAIMNVGVWGPHRGTYESYVDANRWVEQLVSELSGRKWLYAPAYYPKEEFWTIYDHAWYDDLRQKYYASTLPTVYDKTRGGKSLKVSSKRGVWKAIIGRGAIKIN